MFFSGSNSQENTIVEKSVSMNTTVNGSSFWSCSGLINPKAEKIGATVSYSLSLVFALAEMHVGSWFIGGTFAQALCKLHIFLADASSFLSIQAWLVLITIKAVSIL